MKAAEKDLLNWENLYSHKFTLCVIVIVSQLDLISDKKTR
jgi:hypothetical protein